jgi:hypothetical protein
MIRNVTRCLSLLVAVMLVGTTAAMATTNTNYSVAPVSGNYQELFFGTTHAVGAGINDEVVVDASLGFNFTVGNTVFNTVNVHANGYISFGGTGITSTPYAPLTAPDVATAVVSAWGNDLVGTDNASIMTQLQGTPGNYTFVIQWKEMTRMSYVGTNDDRYNFQIRLVQSNNSIDIVYGGMSVHAPYSVHVGMRGVEGTNSAYAIVGDYNRNTWAQPAISMTAAAATPEKGFAPVAGQTYRFARRVAPGSNNDAAILSVGTQAANYAAGTSQSIVARIKNFGTNNLDSVVIEWKVNGGNRTAVKYYPQPAIAPNGEATVTLGFETFGDKSWNTLWARALTVNGQNDPVAGNNTYTSWAAPAVGGNLAIATVGVNSAVGH